MTNVSLLRGKGSPVWISMSEVYREPESRERESDIFKCKNTYLDIEKITLRNDYQILKT